MPHDLPLITTIAGAFAAAWVLGIITQKLKLSPIVGYLLAGVAIGPHTPGLQGDIKIAQQLAEVGVILLMFGVGLHFSLRDLLAVRKVAVPGAIGQSLAATVLSVIVAMAFGWSLKSGIVLGMAMSVASTVVLIRVLMDNKQLDTPQGTVAVGWLIVEDIFTVVVLVLIPALAAPEASGTGLLWALAIALLKLAALVVVMLIGGRRVIPWMMVKVARLRSRELFTLTVLVMSIAVAAGAAYFFGASMALGAFLAGMVVGQSKVSSQAAAELLPLRDAFAVLFFASVGMLFDPMFAVQHPWMMLAGLGIVLLGKPAAALIIVIVLGYPLRTALTVAIALAQIGEFSFILSDLGRYHGLLNQQAHNLLVATALVSITLNPILFRLAGPIESAIRRSPRIWKLLTRRSQKREFIMNQAAEEAILKSSKPIAVILGYGPVGRAIDSILRDDELQTTVVVDLNMDTVESLTRAGRAAIFGDAYNIEVMAQALAGATHLIITLPHSINRNPIIAAAKLINPAIKVFVRAHYLAERPELAQVGADAVAYEEAEVSAALARLVMADRGVDDETIRREVTRIRRELTSSSAR